MNSFEQPHFCPSLPAIARSLVVELSDRLELKPRCGSTALNTALWGTLFPFSDLTTASEAVAPAKRWANGENCSTTGSGPGFTKPPNIMIILTDDQDGHMETITREHMPYLNEYIIDKGASHPNHYCTIALCCPSRASLWTGLQGHNHNVTDVGGPYG